MGQMGRELTCRPNLRQFLDCSAVGLRGVTGLVSRRAAEGRDVDESVMRVLGDQLNRDRLGRQKHERSDGIGDTPLHVFFS